MIQRLESHVDHPHGEFDASCPGCLKKQVDELAMLIRMLVHSTRKTNPDNETAKKAMDYLTRHNLQGSPLR